MQVDRELQARLAEEMNGFQVELNELEAMNKKLSHEEKEVRQMVASILAQKVNFVVFYDDLNRKSLNWSVMSSCKIK